MEATVSNDNLLFAYLNAIIKRWGGGVIQKVNIYNNKLLRRVNI